MALFSTLGSMHILSLLGLTTVTILDTQSVASLTGARMFSSPHSFQFQSYWLSQDNRYLAGWMYDWLCCWIDLNVVRVCETSKTFKNICILCQDVVINDCLRC